MGCFQLLQFFCTPCYLPFNDNELLKDVRMRINTEYNSGVIDPLPILYLVNDIIVIETCTLKYIKDRALTTSISCRR